MRTDVIVYKFKHYHMDDNKGLSVVVQGSIVDTNNETGLQITESPVLSYSELNYLKTIEPNSFPAKFTADMEFTRVKAKNGKETTGIAFKNLEFVCSMKLIEDSKVPKKTA